MDYSKQQFEHAQDLKKYCDKACAGHFGHDTITYKLAMFIVELNKQPVVGSFEDELEKMKQDTGCDNEKSLRTSLSVLNTILEEYLTNPDEDYEGKFFRKEKRDSLKYIEAEDPSIVRLKSRLTKHHDNIESALEGSVTRLTYSQHLTVLEAMVLSEAHDLYISMIEGHVVRSFLNRIYREAIENVSQRPKIKSLAVVCANPKYIQSTHSSDPPGLIKRIQDNVKGIRDDSIIGERELRIGQEEGDYQFAVNAYYWGNKADDVPPFHGFLYGNHILINRLRSKKERSDATEPTTMCYSNSRLDPVLFMKVQKAFDAAVKANRKI